MKSILPAVLLFQLIGSSAVAEELRFNFFYVWAGRESLISETELDKRIGNAVKGIESTFDIKIYYGKAEKFFHKPDVIIYRSRPGINAGKFFADFRRFGKHTGTNIVITDLIWDKKITPLGNIHISSLAGMAELGQKDILLQFKSDEQEFTAGLLHEWGHILGLEHPDEQMCANIYLIMCSSVQKNKIPVIDSYFRDIIKTHYIFTKSLSK